MFQNAKIAKEAWDHTYTAMRRKGCNDHVATRAANVAQATRLRELDTWVAQNVGLD